MINSHAIASMGARRGARVGRRPSPPPQKYKKYFWAILGAFMLRFSHLGAFSPCGGLFATFYFMGEAFFWACPPPYENFCGRP